MKRTVNAGPNQDLIFKTPMQYILKDMKDTFERERIFPLENEEPEPRKILNYVSAHYGHIKTQVLTNQSTCNEENEAKNTLSSHLLSVDRYTGIFLVVKNQLEDLTAPKTVEDREHFYQLVRHLHHVFKDPLLQNLEETQAFKDHLLDHYVTDFFDQQTPFFVEASKAETHALLDLLLQPSPIEVVNNGDERGRELIATRKISKGEHICFGDLRFERTGDDKFNTKRIQITLGSRGALIGSDDDVPSQEALALANDGVMDLEIAGKTLYEHLCSIDEDNLDQLCLFEDHYQKETQTSRGRHVDDKLGILRLKAGKDIAENEPITWSYGPKYWIVWKLEKLTPSTEQLKTAIERMKSSAGYQKSYAYDCLKSQLNRSSEDAKKQRLAKVSSELYDAFIEVGTTPDSKEKSQALQSMLVTALIVFKDLSCSDFQGTTIPFKQGYDASKEQWYLEVPHHSKKLYLSIQNPMTAPLQVLEACVKQHGKTTAAFKAFVDQLLAKEIVVVDNKMSLAEVRGIRISG